MPFQKVFLCEWEFCFPFSQNKCFQWSTVNIIQSVTSLAAFRPTFNAFRSKVYDLVHFHITISYLSEKMIYYEIRIRVQKYALKSRALIQSLLLYIVQHCCVTATAALSINHICVYVRLWLCTAGIPILFFLHNIIEMYGTCYWRT